MSAVLMKMHNQCNGYDKENILGNELISSSQLGSQRYPQRKNNSTKGEGNKYVQGIASPHRCSGCTALNARNDYRNYCAQFSCFSEKGENIGRNPLISEGRHATSTPEATKDNPELVAIHNDCSRIKGSAVHCIVTGNQIERENVSGNDIGWPAFQTQHKNSGRRNPAVPSDDGEKCDCIPTAFTAVLWERKYHIRPRAFPAASVSSSYLLKGATRSSSTCAKWTNMQDSVPSAFHHYRERCFR